MSLPYFGNEAENTVQRTKKRLFKLFRWDKEVIFKVQFQTSKLSFFTSNKDKTTLLSCSNPVYQYSCPGCPKSYIGKTESTLSNRTMEHAWKDQKSALNKHFKSCSAWKEIVDLFEVYGKEVDTKDFQVNAVRENTKIITRCDN